MLTIMSGVSSEPRIATRRDFDEIVSSLSEFWGERDVAHLHHPTAIDEFGDSALVISDPQGPVAAYLFGMIVSEKRLGYVHVVAVPDDQRHSRLASPFMHDEDPRRRQHGEVHFCCGSSISPSSSSCPECSDADGAEAGTRCGRVLLEPER